MANIHLNVSTNGGSIVFPKKSGQKQVGVKAEVTRNPYLGAYDVTPRLYEQTLPTKGKSMSDNVKVYEIPITSTSNLEGGLTVLIG